VLATIDTDWYFVKIWARLWSASVHACSALCSYRSIHMKKSWAVDGIMDDGCRVRASPALLCPRNSTDVNSALYTI